MITLTLHHEINSVSQSCVLLLNKAYRINRAVQQEIARAHDEDKIDEEIERNGSEEKLYCSCREPYDDTRDMVECTNCREWYHLDCLNLSDSIFIELEDRD